MTQTALADLFLLCIGAAFALLCLGCLACAPEVPAGPIDPAELEARIASGNAPVILDVRTEKEFAAGPLWGLCAPESLALHSLTHDAALALTLQRVGQGFGC